MNHTVPEPLKQPIVSEIDSPVVPELINPLDRPSSPEPEENPFHNPELELESIPLSRSTSHTLSFRHDTEDDDQNSMSDWTEAFDNHSETDGTIDYDSDSDSDVVSDAESEASWAQVRSSRSVGFN
jgi:hypothetical protein